MRRGGWLVGITTAVLLAAGLPRPGHAQPRTPRPTPAGAPAGVTADGDKQRARELYQRGQEQFERGQYAAAIEIFREGYALAPRPQFLFNIAQAYRLVGECERAREFYESYLRAMPAASNRAIAEKHLAATVRCIEQQRMAREASAAAPAPAPGANTVPVSAAPAAAAAPPAATRAAAPAAAPVSAAPAAPAGTFVATAPGSSPPAGLGRGRLAGLGLVALGGAALGLSVVFALDAASASRQVDEVFDAGGQWEPRLAEVERRGQRSETRSIVFAGVSLGLFAGGALLYHLGGRRGERRPLAVDLALGRDGAIAGLRWTPVP